MKKEQKPSKEKLDKDPDRSQDVIKEFTVDIEDTTREVARQGLVIGKLVEILKRKMELHYKKQPFHKLSFNNVS
jgi:hypothetical protein